MANWNFFSQFCETCESMFLVISIFSEKDFPKNESRRSLAGQGGAWWCCAQQRRPVLAPLSLKATPGRLISGPHNPTSPCSTGREEAPRPKCVACHRCTQSCTWTSPPRCSSPRPALLLPKSGLSTEQQPELLEIPVAHRSVSATSITNLS